MSKGADITTPDDNQRILEALEGLRRDMVRLEARLTALEATRAGATEPADAEPIEPETMMAIAAAVAAFFGKRARVRSVRLLRSEVWAHQGRATTQAWYSVSSNPRK